MSTNNETRGIFEDGITPLDEEILNQLPLGGSIWVVNGTVSSLTSTTQNANKWKVNDLLLIDGSNRTIMGTSRKAYTMYKITAITESAITLVAAGMIMPAGGAKRQVLAKKSNTDFDMEWIDIPKVEVEWTGLTANGSSNNATTTALTLTFDKDPGSEFTASNITVSGATKGALSSTGKTRILNISGSFNNNATVTVSLTNPGGINITPTSKTVTVYKAARTVVSITTGSVSTTSGAVPNGTGGGIIKYDSNTATTVLSSAYTYIFRAPGNIVGDSGWIEIPLMSGIYGSTSFNGSFGSGQMMVQFSQSILTGPATWELVVDFDNFNGPQSLEYTINFQLVR